MKNIVKHAESVDAKGIQPIFSSDGFHRFVLRIPFTGQTGSDVLCVIGQNPSFANKEFADQTVRFLERYVKANLPNYSELLIINLYSRIDTNKSHSSDPSNSENEKMFSTVVAKCTDFLVIFGQIKNEGQYKFEDQARWAAPLLKGKSVVKFDLDTPYAPHPGNRAICYSRLDVGLTTYNFLDIMRA